MKYIFTSLFILINMLFAQQDMTEGYRPRNLTRGKMWSSYRNNGLDGGGNRSKSDSHSQESLTYPGNMSRVGLDFIEYFIDVSAYLAGEPNVIEIPRVTIPQSSKGQGVWILAVDDQGDTLVSYSGPRNVTYDVQPAPYNINNSPEAVLGDTTYHNLERSNFSTYHNSITGNEPIEIHNYRYHHYTAHNNSPEEIIISQWNTKTGIRVTRKAYAWGYPNFDDFIIQELVFENIGTKILDPAYLTLMNSFSLNSMAHGWADKFGMNWSDWRHNRQQTQDDLFFYTKADTFTADDSENTDLYKNYIMFYQRDDDWFGTNWDDTGQPYKLEAASAHADEMQGQLENQLLAYQYIGMGVLDYLPDNTNFVHPSSAIQPVYAKWWHGGENNQFDYEDPNSGMHTDQEMFTMVIGNNDQDITKTPQDPGLGTHALVFGPYRLEPGQKTKLVIAFVGGSGADWLGEDELTWSTTEDATAERILGERSMFRNFDRAKFAYENNYNVPDPPPDVKISFANTQLGQIKIKWSDDVEDAQDPDYENEEARDVRGYRVYKSWPPSHYWHYGPWEFLIDIPIGSPKYYEESNGTYSYIDSTSYSGYNYYYSVHTYDSGHDHWIDVNGNDVGPILPLESGITSVEQKNPIAITPYQGSMASFDSMNVPIRVVPNPYRLDFNDPLHMYPDVADPYKLRFINLPKACIIRLYSVNGDLVYERKHTNENSAEESWRQDTISLSGRVDSGIYFWVVESLDPASNGQIQKGTLAIVK
ncbi:MAG TPA: hypothetical protein EYO50_02580 [Candidatus Marinimicrobia bacterium]|jgi:hypothetical protein|nr:hypothetical protein [Candidatus Neomarinimicrobiota bacterium]